MCKGNTRIKVLNDGMLSWTPQNQRCYINPRFPDPRMASLWNSSHRNDEHEQTHLLLLMRNSRPKAIQQFYKLTTELVTVIWGNGVLKKKIGKGDPRIDRAEMSFNSPDFLLKYLVPKPRFKFSLPQRRRCDTHCVLSTSQQNLFKHVLSDCRS